MTWHDEGGGRAQNKLVLNHVFTEPVVLRELKLVDKPFFIIYIHFVW